MKISIYGLPNIKKVSKTDPKIIFKAVSEAFGVPVEKITSPGRGRERIEARWAAIYLLVKNLPLTLAEVGFLFVGEKNEHREHTFILQALARAEDLLFTDQEFKAKIEAAKVIGFSNPFA